MRINTNIQALNTHRMMGISSSAAGKNLEKLSSGKKINKASDNAAGLAISEKMDAQIRGLKMASKNSMDGMSLIQTAEGALIEVHSMLQRVRELSVQAANDTNQLEDREAMEAEVKQLVEEIDRIGQSTEFNGIKLLGNDDPTDLDLTVDREILIQSGANAEQMTLLKIEKIGSTKLGIDTLDLKDNANASLAITAAENAIKAVSGIRSKMGAVQNRLEKTMANLDNTAENLTAAKSRIQDTDMALEMSEFTKLNIMQQAGTAMLQQANQQPQMILKLLNA